MERVSDRIDTMKILAGELLIDNCHLRRIRRVVFVEFAPRQNTDAHRLEITRTRTIEKGGFVTAGSRRAVRTDAIIPTTSAYWSETDLRRRSYAWYRRQMVKHS